MKRIRVLHILPHIGIGGINRFVLDIVHYQKENQNIEIGIFVLSKSNMLWKDKLDELNVSVYFGNIKSMDVNLSHYSYFRNVESQYDIVHWHIFVPLLCLMTFFDKKIHIFTHHSVLGIGRTSKYSDKFKWQLFRFWVNKRLDCEVYNSKYSKDFWQNYGLKAKRNTLIYNGMRFDDDFSKSSSNNLCFNSLKNKFIIGTSSNFIGWKRVDLLISAFSKWATDKDDVTLLLVGDGIERKTLEDEAYKDGQASKILFVGHQTNVTLYQNLMDVCVFPSTTETFGLAALECLYLKKPTICMADGGGICEVVGSHSNTMGSVEDLIKRFDYYYEIKQRLGTCEDEKFKQQALLFNMKDKALEYINTYQSLFSH